jgi:hypothetical protein
MREVRPPYGTRNGSIPTNSGFHRTTQTTIWEKVLKTKNGSRNARVGAAAKVKETWSVKPRTCLIRGDVGIAAQLTESPLEGLLSD